MRILLVEDDLLIVDGLTRALRQRGHLVDVLTRGQGVVDALRTLVHDLLLLDLGLPDIDGIKVLTTLRKMHADLPVLILTARDSIEARVAGLDAGADDYLTKPFSLEELDARLRALGRRGTRALKGARNVGSLVIDTDQRSATLAGTLLALTPREYSVLDVLSQSMGRVVSKSSLREGLCDWSEDVTSNALDVYIHRLRRKFEQSDVEIRTIRGFGYLLRSTTMPEVES